MPRYQIRDETSGLAFYTAETARSALEQYARNKVEASERIGLTVEVGPILSETSSGASAVIDGRLYHAVIAGL